MRAAEPILVLPEDMFAEMLYYNKKSPVFAGLFLFFNTENGFSRLRHQQPLDIAPLIKIDTERISDLHRLRIVDTAQNHPGAFSLIDIIGKMLVFANNIHK